MTSVDMNEAELSTDITGTLAHVTLRRTRALNALTIAMRRELADAFPRFARHPDIYAVVMTSASERAFSAGSDVREIVALARADKSAARQAFREEYRLNWQIECFSKPCVSLIDGLVMGGGVGISLYGTHRVAAERYSFAMPETLIGFFPDVGVCHALARMPDEIGTYLALTGRSVGRADAMAFGLATHAIDAQHFPAIIRALADTEPVDPLLDGLHEDPGPGALEPLRDTIAHCFSALSVAEILARLDAVSGRDADWASGVAADLRQRSPSALVMTLQHIRAAALMHLKDVLEADQRLAELCLDQSDFYEGVRAQVIDKDRAPKWTPASIEAAQVLISALLAAPPSEPSWQLPSRADMQAARA